jgi:hypothetical protein
MRSQADARQITSEVRRNPLQRRLKRLEQPEARCAACEHIKYRHDDGGCTLGNNGLRHRGGNGLESRGQLKANGIECWCPQFTTNPQEAWGTILKCGDIGALQRETLRRRDRGELNKARQALDQYVVRTPRDARDPLWIDKMEHSISQREASRIPQSPKRTPQHRPIDPRKELIARLKARDPNTNARKICELIDQKINKEAPIRQNNFAPLERWGKQASGERSWVGFYDHTKTHSLVRSYVNKVPPLKTSK